MLTTEDNDLLTKTGPGTPCGAFMRRYWQPVALSEELLPDGGPLPVRLLGEDLVLFRDEAGRPGLLGLHCSHRGMDLSYGRLEDGGLRCVYHGWLYDIEGRCLEQPGEPPERTFHEKIRHPAYPCREAGGLVFAYLGPGEPPLLPAYEFLQAAEEYRFGTKIFHDCNYQQSNEGNLDPVHTPFLHRVFGRPNALPPSPASQRVSVDMDAEETDFGVRVVRATPSGEDELHVRATHFVLPNLSAIPAGFDDGYTVNWHVPIDDTHHWKYVIRFTRETPLDDEKVRMDRSELTPDYRLVRNKSNRYLQDREEMKSKTFIGLGRGFQAHDALATEGPGPIQDRTREHLASSDRAIVLIRQSLLRGIRQVLEGQDAPHVTRDPSLNSFPQITVWQKELPASADWRGYARERTLAYAGPTA